MAAQVSKFYKERWPSDEYCLDQKKDASRTLEGRGRELTSIRLK